MINLISKAKAVLILDLPFFASILLGLNMVEDKSAKTLNVDGETIRYNPDFMAKLNMQQTVFVLAHETMHCVLQHMHRMGNKELGKYNRAADYVINEILVNGKIGTMPDGGLKSTELVQAGGETTEGVYKLLP